MLEIHTSVVNNPTFIELQYLTLQKYVKGDYIFKVFNDAKDFPDYSNNQNVEIKGEIRKTCERLNIECIEIPNFWHKTHKDAADRCADAMGFMLKNYHIKSENQILIIDSDMLPISDFDISRYNNLDLVIVPQYRKNFRYFWNGICYFNMETLKNKELLNWWVRTPDNKFKADVGTAMKDFLAKPGNKIYEINHLSSGCWNDSKWPKDMDTFWLDSFYKKDPRNKNGMFFAELYDDVFFHYRAGGNWDKIGFNIHEQRTKLLSDCVYEACKYQ